MRKLGLLVLMTIIGAWAGIARGRNVYPSQPVRIIIPFPAGSTTDTLTRIVADQLSRKWSKAVVVANLPGMTLGAQRVTRADPDGYTLLSSPPVAADHQQAVVPRP